VQTAVTTGWIVLKGEWHYFRGTHTLCRKRVRRTDIDATLALKLREMTPHDHNCRTCETKRLKETGAKING